MNEELNTDELLNGFIDEELTERQQTEVQRLIAHDPQIARRLEQLQKCRLLVSSLPYDEAPADMAKQVKAALERRALSTELPITTIEERKGARHLMFRKVFAAAAMLTLVAILAAVIYTIVAPQPSAPVMGFVGRLELKSTNLAVVNAAINEAIENNGLANSVSLKHQQGKNIYAITCKRESLTSLLADLDSIWDRFDSATLFVETKTPDKQVVVDGIKTRQIIDVLTPPIPRLTGDEKTTEKLAIPAADRAKVHLTIVVAGSETNN